MKPTAELLEGRVQLWRGDALEVLREMPEVDHVVVDPPYEADMHNSKVGCRGIRTDGYQSPKALDFTSIDGLREKLTPLMVEKCSKWLLCFCTPEGIAPWRDAIEAAGARYKRACFWFKPDAAPQFNGQGPAFAVEPFVAAWCGRGRSRWNGGGRRNLFTHLTNSPDRQGEHPTEKPLSLMIELLELFTQPDDLVLDPCMGSGTTIIAAIATGRRAMGIEKDPKYFALAQARIEASLSMGRAEGARHITRAIGKPVELGPLFESVA